jgi:hypothetical protein
VGGIITLCRMHHVAGAPHQLHTRFSRVNRHVIKWAGKKHRKSFWGTNTLLAQYLSYATTSTALLTGRMGKRWTPGRDHRLSGAQDQLLAPLNSLNLRPVQTESTGLPFLAHSIENRREKMKLLIRNRSVRVHTLQRTYSSAGSGASLPRATL